MLDTTSYTRVVLASHDLDRLHRRTPVEKLLKSTDLSELIDVPLKTLADWRARGTGPTYVRVGQQVRYRPADVERWLEEQTARSATA
jgi:predicted DNA-binding transcriptional regulator AlpA